MGNARSVDELLVKVQNEQSGIDSGEPSSSPEPQPEPTAEVEQPEVAAAEDQSAPEGHDVELSEAKAEEPEAEDDKPADSAVADSPIDEYGNPVEKPKTYTQEEFDAKLNQLMRDRNSRGKYAEQQQQPTQQQVQQAASDGFQADPNSEESWEAQLEQFIEKTIEKRQAKHSEAQWRQQEAQRQSEFESKFTSGMGKYQDFHQVVSGKPITDEMMLATRGMENPAAFIYAACKMKSAELARIASIPDRAIQMVEIGRLDAEMRKEHNRISTAPKPVQAVKGDMPIKQNEMPSIDNRIHQYAKQKFARK